MRINKMPIFYENSFETGIVYVIDLLFDWNDTGSFNKIFFKQNQ